MTVEKLDDSRLLICLCRYDMEKLNLCEENMTLKNQDFKDTIKTILSVAMHQSGTQSKGKRAFVEALPYDEGCFLLVTFASKERKKKKYIVHRKKAALYSFDDFEDIINMSLTILRLGVNSGRNCIFESEGKYYLYTDTCPLRAECIINEFGNRVNATAAELARFNEYGNIIAQTDAINKIGLAFMK